MLLEVESNVGTLLVVVEEDCPGAGADLPTENTTLEWLLTLESVLVTGAGEVEGVKTTMGLGEMSTASSLLCC